MGIGRRILLVMAAIAASSLAAAAARLEAKGDIVWPTYERVVYPGDLQLPCMRLQARLDHVNKDPELLKDARSQTRSTLISEWEVEQWGGRTGRAMVILADAMNKISLSYQIGRASCRERV